MTYSHIYPTDDVFGHEPSRDCHCGPWEKYQIGDRIFIMHNAWDARTNGWILRSEPPPAGPTLAPAGTAAKIAKPATLNLA